MTQTPVILSVAGSDSIGGAGVQADLRVATRLGVYALTAITCVTAQTRSHAADCTYVPTDMLKRQIQVSATDLKPLAVKTGLLPTSEHIIATAESLIGIGHPPIVVDPVLGASGGCKLTDNLETIMSAYIERLFPLAVLVTPNIPEAKQLCGLDLESQIEPVDLLRLFVETTSCTGVLLKGGHAPERKEIYTDLLYFNGKTYAFSHDRIETTNTHGTGCALSSAITCLFASNNDMVKSVEIASDLMHKWLKESVNQNHGAACGPCII